MPLTKQEITRLVSALRSDTERTLRSLIVGGFFADADAVEEVDFEPGAETGPVFQQLDPLPHAGTHAREGDDWLHVEDVDTLCVNRTGFDIDAPAVVAVVGIEYDEDLGISRPSVALADPNDAALMPPFGVVFREPVDESLDPIEFTDGIPNDGEGRVMRLGRIRNVDTEAAGWNSGEELYLSQTTPGGLTNVPPTSGVVYQIATVMSNEFEGIGIENEGAGELIIQIENMTDLIGAGAGGFNHRRAMIRAFGRC